MVQQKLRYGALLCALALFGCGESDFTPGVWTWQAGGDPEFSCRGNLKILVIENDRIRDVSLGRVMEDWQGLKTQFREDGAVVVKGRSGDVFRFRNEGDGVITLEDAPSEIGLNWSLPVELVRCPQPS